MIAADIGRALLLTTIRIAALRGQLHIELLVVVVALTGVLAMLFDAAFAAYLPVLNERKNLIAS